MLPALRTLSQCSQATATEVRGALATEFRLTANDLAELLPSKRQTTFANRVAWAYSYLKQAGLISSPKRGVYEITMKGTATLAQDPARIDIGFLNQFPEFRAFRQPGPGSERDTLETLAEVGALTPDEEIRAGYRRLREVLAAQLLDRAKNVSPAAFERMVVDVLVGLGYGGSRLDAGEVVGGGGDEGIDGIIKEDRLGLD